VNGSSSLDSPEPRASKTITRYRSANGPNDRFGSDREPSPGAPWCTIIAGASTGPNASTTSSAPLIVSRPEKSDELSTVIGPPR
jgi:hypothetical protein